MNILEYGGWVKQCFGCIQNLKFRYYVNKLFVFGRLSLGVRIGILFLFLDVVLVCFQIKQIENRNFKGVGINFGDLGVEFYERDF